MVKQTSQIERISEIVERLKETGGSVKSNEILNFIENNTIALTDFVNTFSSKEIIDLVSKNIVRNQSSIDRSVLEANTKYMSSLPPKYRGSSNVFQESMVTVVKIILNDLELIQKNFNKYFPTPRLDLEQLKISHIVIFGYISCVRAIIDFNAYMNSYMTDGKNASEPPKYRKMNIQNNLPLVIDTVRYLLLRGGTIVNDLDGVIRGSNVFIARGDSELSSYTSDSEYSEGTRGFFGGFSILTPFMWITDSISSISRTQYRRNLMMKEWIEAKLAKLRMDLAGIDPNSPEYKEKEKVIANYDRMLTDYDKKIAEYEQSL